MAGPVTLASGTAPAPAKPEAAPAATAATGLSGVQAAQRLAHDGPNQLAPDGPKAWRDALKQFWAPVPWMLEGTVVLELALGKTVEALIIACLLSFNAALGLLQQSRAQATLAALRSRLALQACVLRDGRWSTVPALDVVAGDLVKLSIGGVVPADVQLTTGTVLLDQSMLTGESLPVQAGPGAKSFAGALVQRGEALAQVTAIGAQTEFGRTAKLVRDAHVVSTQQKAVLRVISLLAVFNGTVILVLIAYAWHIGMTPGNILPLALTCLLASIPVALPATFTLAAAIGARALVKVGVLPTRLTAVDEAASIDVLCADKTGTLTQNFLAVTQVHPLVGFSTQQLLTLAAWASAEGGQDPVDAVIRKAAHAAAPAPRDAPTSVHFTPFDPATKMSEASGRTAAGTLQRVVKGAPQAVLALAAPNPAAAAVVTALESRGWRVLAVAAGPPGALVLAGFVALSDPPRPDSAALVSSLRTLGVRMLMVTGDSALTATTVAQEVGLTGPARPAGPLPAKLRPEDFSVYAGVLPEDKFKIVKALQNSGHAVGMCGDGVNDAPALRQAQMGIAVSTATDVAKSAAGIVLTTAGLGGVLAAIKEGRITFQRIQTYTLNSITSKILQVMLLAACLFVTGQAILTPLLMVIIMITGDFLGMSLTTDNVQPSPLPNAWRIGRLAVGGVIVGLCSLAFCGCVLLFGRLEHGYDIDHLRTLALVAIVFVKQATTYTNRERRWMWSSRPSGWLVASSCADVAIASTLAIRGIAMTSLPASLVADTFGAAVVFAFALDLAKVPTFRRLGIR